MLSFSLPLARLRRLPVRTASSIAALVFALTFCQARGQTAPSLGTASSYTVLGGSTVTNTGPTVVTGDLGVSPGTSITGFPPGIVAGGTTHAADASAAQAQADATTAYNTLSAEACTAAYNAPADLSGQTLVPGVYCFASSLGLTGTLILDGGGNPAATFIFKIGSTLITGSDASVELINGAQQCDVFYRVGSSATLGTGTRFVGNILALASITLDANTTLSGRALARTGAVTLDSNTVSPPSCAPVVTPPTLAKSFSPATVSLNGISTLTLTLTNTNAASDTLTAPLNDSFPSGIVVAGAASTNCGGVVTAIMSSGSLTLTGGAIPADGSCVVTVPVKGLRVGSYINSIVSGALMTTEGKTAAPAVATLTVTGTTGEAPTVGKSFSPSTIMPDGISTVTLTLNNSDSTPATLSSPLTDSLPIGVRIKGIASTTCGGEVTAINGGTSITIAGGVIPAGGSCTVTAPVTACCSGNYYNSIRAGALVTSNGSNAQASIATLTVSVAPAPGGPPTLGKSFWPDDVVPGGTATLYLDLRNRDATAAHLTAPLVDHLPVGITVVGRVTSSCGGTVTAVPGSTSVTLAGATIPINSACRVTVLVSATSNGRPSAPGNYVNSLGIGALRTSNGSNEQAASATLTVSASADVGPTLAKMFSPTSIKLGQSSTLTIELKNASSTAARLTAPLTDRFPGRMVVTGPATNTCGGKVTAAAGSSTLTLVGGSIPAKGSCRLTVPVTAICGYYWNRIGVAALQTSIGSNKETYGAGLSVTVN